MGTPPLLPPRPMFRPSCEGRGFLLLSVTARRGFGKGSLLSVGVDFGKGLTGERRCCPIGGLLCAAGIGSGDGELCRGAGGGTGLSLSASAASGCAPRGASGLWSSALLCALRALPLRCGSICGLGRESAAAAEGNGLVGGGGGTCGGAGSPFVVLNARTHPGAPRSVTLKSDEQFARGAPVRSLEGMAAVRRPLHAARQVGDEALHDLLQLLHEPRVGRQLASLRGEADRDLIHVVGFPVCCQKREVSGGRTGAHLPFTPVCFIAAIRALIRT